MSAIDRRQNPFAAGQRTQFFGGQHYSRERRDVAEEQHTGLWGDCITEQVQHLGGIFHRTGKRDLFHHDSIALGL